MRTIGASVVSMWLPCSHIEMDRKSRPRKPFVCSLARSLNLASNEQEQTYSDTNAAFAYLPPPPQPPGKLMSYGWSVARLLVDFIRFEEKIREFASQIRESSPQRLENSFMSTRSTYTKRAPTPSNPLTRRRQRITTIYRGGAGKRLAVSSSQSVSPLISK